MTADHIDRAAEVMIEHTRTRIEGCHCGWSKLGASHAEHVAQALDAAGLLVTPRRRRHLSEADVTRIVALLDSGELQSGIAREYGVTRQVINDIATGRTWGWLTGRADRIEAGESDADAEEVAREALDCTQVHPDCPAWFHPTGFHTPPMPCAKCDALHAAEVIRARDAEVRADERAKVLAMSDAVERAAEVLFQWNIKSGPYFVIGGSGNDLARGDDPYLPIAQALADAGLLATTWEPCGDNRLGQPTGRWVGPVEVEP